MKSRIWCGVIAGVLSCTALTPAGALGQTDREALQRRIDVLQAELDALKAAVKATTPTSTQQPAASTATRPTLPMRLATIPICRMETPDDFDQASLEPNKLTTCAWNATELNLPAGSVTDEPPETDADRAGTIETPQPGPLPNQPFPAAGVTTAVEFGGDSSRAFATYSHPFYLRKRITEGNPEAFAGFRPQLLLLSGTLGVPVKKGERIFFDNRERATRADFDVLSGTTFRVGLDLLTFGKEDRQSSFRRTAQALADARTQCRKARKLPEAGGATDVIDHLSQAVTVGVAPAPSKEECTGTDLIGFVMELKADRSGYKRPDLAAAYQASFWREEKTAIPRWGVGGSIEYGSDDFAFRQAELATTVNSKGRNVLTPNQDAALAPEKIISRDQWKLQSYGMYFHPTLKTVDRTGLYTEGLMFIAGGAWQSAFEYRPQTADQTICELKQAKTFLTCAPLNIDRPVRREFFTVSGEVRMQLNNVPVVGALGFAPRFTHRLEDNRNLAELPVYFAGKDGVISAGFRVRHSWNGRDLLQNPDLDVTDASIFLSSTLDFRKMPR